jgi:hypothetical protein
MQFLSGKKSSKTKPARTYAPTQYIEFLHVAPTINTTILVAAMLKYRRASEERMTGCQSMAQPSYPVSLSVYGPQRYRGRY